MAFLHLDTDAFAILVVPQHGRLVTVVVSVVLFATSLHDLQHLIQCQMELVVQEEGELYTEALCLQLGHECLQAAIKKLAVFRGTRRRPCPFATQQQRRTRTRCRLAHLPFLRVLIRAGARARLAARSPPHRPPWSPRPPASPPPSHRARRGSQQSRPSSTR